jgi:Ala-tRNA(Pro) deacylase
VEATVPPFDLKSEPGSVTERLLALLDGGGARYRLIDHPPEGRTERASELRGHPLAQAAKSIIIRTRMAKKAYRYVLAVVPGDRRVDLERIRALVGARDAGVADRPTAESLARTVSGTIVPFAFEPQLELVVDPSLLAHRELFFNAAALDRSIALRTADYVTLARPVVHTIAETSNASGDAFR